jgi:peptidoglycan hydrolase-like protein with peptidoglycan-binding domain
LAAVINYQKTEGAKLNPPLRVDGVVDDATYNASIMAIPEPAFELSVAKKSKGDDVKLIQQKLGIPDDGKFETGTETAVIDFQTEI